MPHDLIEMLTLRIGCDRHFVMSRPCCVCIGVKMESGTEWLEADFTGEPTLSFVDLPSEKAQTIVRFSEAQADALCAGHAPEDFRDAELEGDAALLVEFLNHCVLRAPGVS